MRKVFVFSAIVVFLAGTAQAADNCCFDWRPTVGSKPKSAAHGTPPDVYNWAQCVTVKLVGGMNVPISSQADCFLRPGKQVYLPNWQCTTGSNSPDGDVPGNANSGYLCDDKNVTQDMQIALRGNKLPLDFREEDGTVPDPGDDILDKIAAENDEAPAASTLGLGLITLLVIGGGVWLFRRQSAGQVA